MTDIVERLKSEQVVSRSRGDKECDDVCGEAANEIERLRADNTRLRAALDEINMASFPLTGSVWCAPIGAWDNAMRALEGDDD